MPAGRLCLDFSNHLDGFGKAVKTIVAKSNAINNLRREGVNPPNFHVLFKSRFKTILFVKNTRKIKHNIDVRLIKIREQRFR
jgi:hypothetical protein